MMQNVVRLLESDIIYIENAGDQTAGSMRQLYAEVSVLAAQLRHRGRPVLILSNATRESAMSEEVRNVSVEIGGYLDFDRSATYTNSSRLYSVRDLMIRINGFDQKAANFQTEDEALAWLLAFQPSAARR